MNSTPGRRAARSGWVTFVGAYLALAGVLNVLWAAGALADKRNFAENELVWSTLSTWGWIALFIGAAQLLGAVLVVTRKGAGPWIAGFLGFLGLMVNFLAIGAYPIWSAILMGVNALVLWACTVHSDEFF